MADRWADAGRDLPRGAARAGARMRTWQGVALRGAPGGVAAPARARPDVGELAGRPSRRPSSRRCPDSLAGRIRYPSTLEVRRARRRRPGARRRADSGPVTGGRTCHRDGCRHYQPGTETSVPIPKPQLAAADSGGVRGEQPVERGVGGPYGDGAGTARRGRDRLHRGGCRGSEACRCPGGKICERSLCTGETNHPYRPAFVSGSGWRRP